MREMPWDADPCAWKFFDAWADGQMLGVLTPDWLPFWECWSAAWSDGREDYVENGPSR